MKSFGPKRTSAFSTCHNQKLRKLGPRTARLALSVLQNRMMIPGRAAISRVLLLILLSFAGDEVSAETAPQFRWADKITWPNLMAGYEMDVDDVGSTYL